MKIGRKIPPDQAETLCQGTLHATNPLRMRGAPPQLFQICALQFQGTGAGNKQNRIILSNSILSKINK